MDGQIISPELRSRLEDHAPRLLEGLNEIKETRSPFQYSISGDGIGEGEKIPAFVVRAQFLVYLPAVPSDSESPYSSGSPEAVREGEIVAAIYRHFYGITSPTDVQHCGVLAGHDPSERAQVFLRNLRAAVDEAMPRPPGTGATITAPSPAV